jgi:hypothetical protein
MFEPSWLHAILQSMDLKYMKCLRYWYVVCSIVFILTLESEQLNQHKCLVEGWIAKVQFNSQDGQDCFSLPPRRD